MKTKPIGLYVHIPFCVQKCNYCDFCSFSIDKAFDRSKYIDMLCREILSYRDRNISVDTLFFGGGTPTLLSGEEFKRIMSAIKSSFNLTADAEITLEANPKTVTETNLDVYLSEGVNRFSIGLQSIHNNELKILGRIHDFEEFLETYKLLRRRGVDNINVDLMYGIPEQNADTFMSTLRFVISIKPEHLSVYGLIFEEGTRFWELRNILNIPTEDEECKMYYDAVRILTDSGYTHYEISNYAMGGRECKHNLKYWRDEEYIGMGLSAYSYFGNVRFGNTKDINAYLQGNFRHSESVECINSTEEAYEYAMLRLRLSEGFSLSEYKQRFNRDFLEGKASIVEKMLSYNYVKIQGDRFALTDKGLYVSNMILAELL